MIDSVFAAGIFAELAYWQQTVIKAGVVAAVIPTAALILGYVFLLKMMSFVQSRLGPDGSRAARHAAAAGRRTEIPPGRKTSSPRSPTGSSLRRLP